MLEAFIPGQVQAGAEAADKFIADQAALNGDPVKPAEEVPADQNPTVKPTEPTETVESLKAKLAEVDQKLSVLQGKYNAEIKALGDDPHLLNTLKAEMRKLKRQNDDFSKIVSDQQHELAKLKAVPQKPADTSIDISAEDLEHLENEGFEGKTLDIFKQLIVKTADQITQQRYGDVSESIKAVQQTAAETQQDKFWKALNEQVPDWRQVNGTTEAPNEDWLNWLDGKAPYQSRTRAEILHESQDQLDYQTCIDLFLDYKREKGIAVPKVPDPKPKPQIDPASLVEPEKGATELPSNAPVYSMAEYKQHYEDNTKGLWKGREEEWTKKRDILDQAYIEDRVK